MNHKLVSIIFLTSLFTALMNTVKAESFLIRPDSSSFEIQRHIDRQTFFDSRMRNILRLLHDKDSEFSIEKKIKTFTTSLKAGPLLLDYIFLDYEHLSGKSDNLKLSLELIEKEFQKLFSIQHELRKITLEHHYIERMNCKITNDKCYQLLFTDEIIKYNIPYFATYKYLKNNLDLYIHDPQIFLDQIVKDLNISGPKDKTLYEKIVDFAKQTENKDQVEIQHSLAIILEHLAEFLVDQKSYRLFQEKSIEELAKKYDLSPSLIKPSDEFLDNTIALAIGKVDLIPNMALLLSEDSQTRFAVNSILSYFKNLDLNEYVK